MRKVSKDYRKTRSMAGRVKPVGKIFGHPNQKIIKTINKLSLERGRHREGVVRDALELMTDRREIIGFWKATKKEEGRGIDFCVRAFSAERGTEIVLLQIKSSKTGARKHQEKAREIGVFGTDFYARIVIVDPGERVESVIPKIKKAIKRHLKNHS